MKFPRYPKYKDSGIEWIGEIPEHWHQTSISRGYQVTLGKMLQNETENENDELLPYLRASNVQLSGVDLEEVKEMYFSPLEKDKLALRKNDLLVCEGGDAGKSVILEREVDDFLGFQNSINRIRPVNGNNERILHYWLNMLKDSGYIDAICNKATFTHYTAEKLKSTPFLYPLSNEQSAISHYLTYAVKKIESLISKQQKMIELLKEKRQALITRAVTKGIDPNVPMKDSGIEWIGEIPEHWKLKRLKYCVNLITEKSDRELEQVGLENIESWSGNYINTKTVFSGEGIKFKVGDVLFGKLRPYLAKVYHAKFPGEAVGEFFVLRTSSSVESTFLFYWLINREHINIIDSSTYGAKMPRVDWDFMGNLPILIPPAIEQAAITKFFTSEINKIEAVILKQQKIIELLKEHRASLITQAVTGKIDVRGLVKEVKELARQTP